MLVSLFKGNRPVDAPEEFYDCLPDECPECGSPLEMSETLTQLRCSNPWCPSKVAQRMVAIASAIGVKDLGESRALSFVRHFGIANPLMLFGYEPDEDGAMSEDISMEVSRGIARQFSERRRFTLAEYVRVANLPFIQNSAFTLFDGFDDLGEAYAAIEAGGVEYVQKRLGVADGDLSVRALRCWDALMTYKEDLLQAVEWVEIVPIHGKDMLKLRACCSTEVGGQFRTKADFYATCNNLYPDIHIEFGSSVTKSTQYLIWGGSAVTNKVKKARAYIEQGINIRIMDANEFLSMLGGLSRDGAGRNT